jgi:hypothetical protein
MALAGIGINPAVFMKSYQLDPSPKWIGQVVNSDSNETHSVDQAAFELTEGVISLRLADGLSQFTKDLAFEFHVGHALAQVLQVEDRLELRRDGSGEWTYWVVRNDVLVIGVGNLRGKYGSNFEIHWREKNRETPKKESQSRSDTINRLFMFNGYAHAVVQLADQRFELKDHEEVFPGSYYVKCLHLGSGGMPGRSPRIGILTTSQLEIRDAFGGYFLFEDHLSKRFMEIYSELFDTFADPQKRNQWPAEEYEKEHKGRLRELELRVGELYLAFGLRPPQSRWG